MARPVALMHSRPYSIAPGDGMDGLTNARRPASELVGSSNHKYGDAHLPRSNSLDLRGGRATAMIFNDGLCRLTALTAGLCRCMP
jgi:hypothetical protein